MKASRNNEGHPYLCILDSSYMGLPLNPRSSHVWLFFRAVQLLQSVILIIRLYFYIYF